MKQVITKPSIKMYYAIKAMREFTAAGITFSITYATYSVKDRKSDGFKTEHGVLLRQGMRNDVSIYADELIGYINAEGKPRWFRACLLLEVNNYTVIP